MESNPQGESKPIEGSAINEEPKAECEKPIVVNNDIEHHIRSQKVDYRFSTTLRDPSISISENSKFCTKEGSKKSSIVILDGSLGRRSHKLTIVVVKRGGLISFGLGSLKKISQSNFQNYSGEKECFSINSSRKATSRTSMSFNHNANILLDSGNVIIVQVTNDMIIFRHKDKENHACIIDLDYSQEQWKDLCLFARLESPNDSIAIMT